MFKRPNFLTIAAFSLVIGVAAAACSAGREPTDLTVDLPTPTPFTRTTAPPPRPSETPADSVTSAATPRAITPDDTNTSAGSPSSSQSLGTAPELAGIGGWINSEPFTLKQLQDEGKTVLIDFWTYTCVNCIRTLPFLRSWHEKYADKGLVIVGVHAPEFEFEKVKENVEEAVAEFQVGWPVAQDNEFQTWRAFQNRFWPAKYLIDPKGNIRYTHFGEGAYDETEQEIRAILEEGGADLSAISAETAPEPEVDSKAFVSDAEFGLTRELYAGYERNYGALASGGLPPYVLHREYYDQQDANVFYTDPERHNNHFIYLQGLWRNEAENLVHARETNNYQDYVAINFFANSVNLVMEPGENGETYEVRLTLDGAPLLSEQAGKDVQFDDNGNSFVLVDEPKMYRLIDLDDFNSHELRLSSNSDAMSLFAFTFGAYKVSPENQE